MKAITIRQPWASLIASGYKKYEFRSWPTKYRGPIYIHAGSGVDKEYLSRFDNLNLLYPKSSIIASADLEDCILMDKDFVKQLHKENMQVYGFDYKEGYYAWKLTNIKPIDNQSDIKGQLGLWNINL